VARPYYRLVPEPEAVLAKTHLPYRLSPARMAKFRAWFLAAPYKVASLPDYALETSSNPFIAFAALPVESRYRFLLDEAEFFIMNFIKGPVCRGQSALSVIEDHFWMVFTAPDSAATRTAEFLKAERGELRLPVSGAGSYSQLLRPRRRVDRFIMWCRYRSASPCCWLSLRPVTAKLFMRIRQVEALTSSPKRILARLPDSSPAHHFSSITF